ncbi:MAG: YgiQ family radical SAM protein [Tindallia sp. MSAO_Bac2]|nr:MAG: YgiQ family radical SAM protein [Tindallia sp. MSAO_Bac2]
MSQDFLPVTQQDLMKRGWKELDFILISGDAYVDHPSFGAAIIGRWLEAAGFKVGIIPQPDWTKDESFTRLGIPRLGFLITGGNLDSMVNHYSVAKKRRKADAYTPGGVTGKRPDRAVTVYARKIRKLFPDKPVILGGIEASLRRMAHYDYWEDRLKPSVLMDTKADLLIYGMGERAILEVAEALNSGLPVSSLTFIPGTAFFCRDLTVVNDPMVLPSWKTLLASKKQVGQSFLKQMNNTDPVSGEVLAEPYEQGFIVQLPPSKPLSTLEMDQVYRLPFTREEHPIHQKEGHIPAFDEVKFSLASNRGCFGGCHFCALTYHQGRHIQTRSHESILEEAQKLISDKNFKGYIHDVGGPTANFRQPACQKQVTHGSCSHRQCMSPSLCSNMDVTHQDYVSLLRKLRKLSGVKKVFIRSGIRYDYLMADPDPTFFSELCRHHVSGQLKVAPEHSNEKVLDLMGKPSIKVFDDFRIRYQRLNEKENLKQYLVPYLISSHPGSDLRAAIELAVYLKELGHQPEQVQDFYPTPGTLSTCMYYTEIDPRTNEKIYVPKNAEEKQMQRALLQAGKKQNHSLIRKALLKAGRQDLIGNHRDALVPPAQNAAPKPLKNKKRKKNRLSR